MILRVKEKNWVPPSGETGCQTTPGHQSSGTRGL